MVLIVVISWIVIPVFSDFSISPNGKTADAKSNNTTKNHVKDVLQRSVISVVHGRKYARSLNESLFLYLPDFMRDLNEVR